MNSKQRRKDRREWKYKIAVSATDLDQYMVIFDWCAKNFGGCVDDGWRDPREYGDYAEWKFNCPKKAALFAMRWQ